MEDVINVNIPVTTSTANDLHGLFWFFPHRIPYTSISKVRKKEPLRGGGTFHSSFCSQRTQAHKNFLDKNPVPAEAEPGLASHQVRIFSCYDFEFSC